MSQTNPARYPSLFERIRAVDGGRTALCFAGIEYSYSFFSLFRAKNDSTLASIRAKNVALRYKNSFELAVLLPSLDGWVGTILLVPNDIESGMRGQFYAQLGINAELSMTGDDLLVAPVENDQMESAFDYTQWVIPTSGTTGIPKLIRHNLGSLSKTVKSDVEMGKQFWWGLTYELSRFAGLQVYLQSMMSGSRLLIPGSKSFSGVVQELKNYGCNALSGTPSFWRKMLMTAEARDMRFKLVTLGGEIATQELLNALKAAYPESKILHIYASTEAGVGFSVKDGKEGFPKSYLDEGVGDVRMKTSAEGCLMIRTPGSSQIDPADTHFKDAGGFIDTGDRISVRGDRVVFLGRLSGAINVGGNKVQPEEVEKALLKHPSVKQAVVYGKPSSILGSIVAADVVADVQEQPDNGLKMDILRLCREELEAFKVPGILRFVGDIQVNSSGKVVRN